MTTANTDEVAITAEEHACRSAKFALTNRAICAIRNTVWAIALGKTLFSCYREPWASRWAVELAKLDRSIIEFWRVCVERG